MIRTYEQPRYHPESRSLNTKHIACQCHRGLPGAGVERYLAHRLTCHLGNPCHEGLGSKKEASEVVIWEIGRVAVDRMHPFSDLQQRVNIKVASHAYEHAD